MKASCLGAGFAVIAATAIGQVAPSQSDVASGAGVSISASGDTNYIVVERGPHQRVWQQTRYEADQSGVLVRHRSTYTELATGLCYRDPATGSWVDSREVIYPLTTGGAAATNGQHRVFFPWDIYSGAIVLSMPDARVLQCRPLGLSYFDGTNSVLIAELTNSAGVILAPGNQVLYTNAFTDFAVDLIYTYSKAGFEQNVVIRSQPPLAPEDVGLNPATTRLQLLTEFFSPTQPRLSGNVLPARAGVALPDETLDFGTMRIGLGRAFLLGDDSSENEVSVAKEWTLLSNRRFLIEEIPLAAVAGQLRTLPRYAAAGDVQRTERLASRELKLPPTRLAEAGKTEPIRTASINAPETGLLMDYSTINTAQTNAVFQGDTTYYISAAVNLFGTNTTFEGRTVIKFASNATLSVSTPVTWLAGMCRPVAMLSQDDTSTGDSINGATGSPGRNGYATRALFFDATAAGTNLVLDHLRVANAKTAVAINGGSGHQLKNIQLLNCGTGIAATNTSFALYNGLMWNVMTNFTGSSSTGDVEQVTVDTANWLNANSQNLSLTNCLLVGVTNSGGFASNAVYSASSGTGIFTAVAGGFHYLTGDSPYVNAGTVNVNPTLAASLTSLTVFPPIAYTNATFSTANAYSPQAQRDTDTPDVGWHYDPLDYVFGGCIANSNLLFTAGTAVGWFRTSSGWNHAGYGIHMADSTTVTFSGTVTAPDYWVRCNTVVEQDLTAGYGPGGIDGWTYPSVANAPLIVANFTKITGMALSDMAFRDDYGILKMQLTDCEFYVGGVGGYDCICSFTNCLFDRTSIWHSTTDTGYPAWYFRNCTFHGGILNIQHQESYPYWFVGIRGNAFDATTITINNPFGTNTAYADYDYNAFLVGANRTTPVGNNDLLVTNSFNWQTSWLGSYYLPTNSTLIDRGDLMADQLGLYHFTTQTNQVKETNSVVDIGYHYVATDASGNPMDTNSDGIPDYLEDANGNGTVDSGEIGWNLTGDLGLKVLITRPRNGSTLP